MALVVAQVIREQFFNFLAHQIPAQQWRGPTEARKYGRGSARSRRVGIALPRSSGVTPHAAGATRFHPSHPPLYAPRLRPSPARPFPLLSVTPPSSLGRTPPARRCPAPAPQRWPPRPRLAARRPGAAARCPLAKTRRSRPQASRRTGTGTLVAEAIRRIEVVRQSAGLQAGATVTCCPGQWLPCATHPCSKLT